MSTFKILIVACLIIIIVNWIYDYIIIAYKYKLIRDIQYLDEKITVDHKLNFLINYYFKFNKIIEYDDLHGVDYLILDICNEIKYTKAKFEVDKDKYAIILNCIDIKLSFFRGNITKYNNYETLLKILNE
jgi:hypothetical protein